MYFDIIHNRKLFAVVDVITNPDLTLSIDLMEPYYDNGKVIKLVRIAVIDKGKLQEYKIASDKSFIYGYLLAKVRDAFRSRLHTRTSDVFQKLDIPISCNGHDYWIGRSVNGCKYPSLVSDKYEAWQYTGTLIGAPKWLEDRIDTYEFKIDNDNTNEITNEVGSISTNNPGQPIVKPNNYIVINHSTNIIRILSESSYLQFIEDYGMSAWLGNH